MLLLFLMFILFFAVLGLCCCEQAFSSCSEWGLLFSCGMGASHCSGFSCCRAQTPGCVSFSSTGSRARAQ